MIGDLFTPALDEELPALAPVQRRALEIALLLREPDGPPPEVRVLGVRSSPPWQARSGEAGTRRARRCAVDGRELGEFSGSCSGDWTAGRWSSRDRAWAACAGAAELDRAFMVFERLPVKPLSISAIHRLLSERLSVNLPRRLMRVHEAAAESVLRTRAGAALVANIREQRLLSLPEEPESIVAAGWTAAPPASPDAHRGAALAAPTVPLLGPLHHLPYTTSSERRPGCSSSTATGSASRIRSSRQPATPRCRFTGASPPSSARGSGPRSRRASASSCHRGDRRGRGGRGRPRCGSAHARARGAALAARSSPSLLSR